ncbi:MAG: pyruvate, phosphate dikinase [Peptococcaceae bacterium]|nr:pyruvate, phosphate dikinase [Peptococcaceae bacterium]
MDTKYVYFFREGNAGMRDLLGGKGANLAEMTNIGLSVPRGFTITTEACREYYAKEQEFPEGLWDQMMPAVGVLEEEMGKRFGDLENPLLVSVRSGAKFSMPGMMDTILNLGLNDQTVEALARGTDNPRFAYDCYRRFIQMFGNVVLEMEGFRFEEILERAKEAQGVQYDSQLSTESLQGLVESFKDLVLQETGNPFPEDPLEQLRQSVEAVFRSWGNHRAVVYRRANKIPDDMGTAVNVQAMVFGNMGDDSGTGVAFTRDPSTGEKVLYGEYLMNAQGEDVVAGIRTPHPIRSLEQENPEIYNQFVEITKTLEGHYKNMQDIEFTIEKGRLFILQTRNGKCTISAALRIAVELCREGVIDREEAVRRVDPYQIGTLLHRRIDDKAVLNVVATGLAASPGAASGKIVFDADTAEERGLAEEKVLLVRMETTPDDIHGFLAAQGILTSRGGMTSHAAVVARHMGKPAVCGCEALKIDYASKTLTIGDTVYHENDVLAIDGGTGRVIVGDVPMRDPELSQEFLAILEWANDIRNLRVLANADTPPDATVAREFGAEGIGLCRTEHMFMDPSRLPTVRKMILAQTLPERQEALDELLPWQEEDFYGILKAMQGLPVTIRLLDPPLHEFLPDVDGILKALAELRTRKAALEGLTDEGDQIPGGDPPEGEGAGDHRDADQSEEAKLAQALLLEIQDQIFDQEVLLRKVRALHELNPMLGHRGCRVGITYPEVYAMQARAIFRAAARLTREGVTVYPLVKVPLVAHFREMQVMRDVVVAEAQKVSSEMGIEFPYQVGAMLEVPRAALTADEIAEYADFFSFGTNDLTQMVFGFSRDDAEGKFLPTYTSEKILPENPFAVLDAEGVGKMMKIGVDLARKVKPEIKIGICGEHGGDPASIQFTETIGLDYVSCSPFRVPVARLAAAHSALQMRE